MAGPQTDLFPQSRGTAEEGSSSTFKDSRKLPVHRWFKYSAGFSALWVSEELKKAAAEGRCRILDPFAGSGTVPIEVQIAGLEGVGLEPHPFVHRVASVKCAWSEVEEVRLGERAGQVLQEAKAHRAPCEEYPDLIIRCYHPEMLRRLDALKVVWRANDDGSLESRVIWLALTSILRSCSAVGTAQWQYVLPNKRKSRTVDPWMAFEGMIQDMRMDLRALSEVVKGPTPCLDATDARTCASVPDDWADLVITSPPYANNYDYADATRLEMTFFGELSSWSDLASAVRPHLLRSCSQHAGRLGGDELDALLVDPILEPIAPGLRGVYLDLASIRKERAGRKKYHAMAVAYFHDLARVWLSLRRVCRPGARVCFVIGDSAPYGVHMPVEDWLGRLALGAGFKSFDFYETRLRNVKWKNRKHRVPLREGRLWVEG